MSAYGWVWVALWVGALVLYLWTERKKNAAVSRTPEIPEPVSIQGSTILHANGNNCPPFYVQAEHNYPVMWCPYCGMEIRERQREEVA